MLLVVVCSAGPAAAQVVTLRPYPGPVLTQGPVVVGNDVVWSQQRCVRQCWSGIFSPPDTAAVYAVRSGRAGRVPQTLYRARLSHSSSGGPRFRYDTVLFDASEQALVTTHMTQRGDAVEGDSSSIVVRAGPPGTVRPVLVDCSDVVGSPRVDLDGNRVAYDPDPCDDSARLVVRDLGTGATVALPEPAGGAPLALRGRFVAWIAGGELVVHDLMTGSVAYSAPATGVRALDLDADGTVAAVSGDARRPCATGRLLRYSMAAPGPADLGPACATGVAIDGGRIVYLGWEGIFRTLRAVEPDGAAQVLVDFGRVRPGGFDFGGERFAWAARDCGGGEALFALTLADAPIGAGSINCRARFRSGVVPVRRRIATVRLRCPPGCAGELSLRHMGRRQFSIPRAGGDVQVRLRRDVWARLQRAGSLPALAKMVTSNRAGDRQARSRQVTLVAR